MRYCAIGILEVWIYIAIIKVGDCRKYDTLWLSFPVLVDKKTAYRDIISRHYILISEHLWYKRRAENDSMVQYVRK